LKQLAPAVNGHIRGEIRLTLEASRPLAFFVSIQKNMGSIRPKAMPVILST
jgi:hypothetical protein